VAGRVPEIWHPETGKSEQASFTIENGITKVTLDLSPEDAVFVVFRDEAKSNSVTIVRPAESRLATLTGEWDIAFQSNRGAPANIKVQDLKSWTTNTDTGIKYFSGTGTYSKEINAPKTWFKKGEQILLDLGDVKNLAEVIVNGKSLGIVWKKPFRVDLTNALKVGSNKLEVKVTNLWVNRLIGDQQSGIAKKITYTSQAFYSANSTILESGLLGPVQIISIGNRDSAQANK
jgi:hypothetical protein